MKRILLSIMFSTLLLMGTDATVLFPHFVDIAPDYEEGNTTELMNAGVGCAIYHSTKPGFMASDFSEVEAFFKDTLPSDVVRTESSRGEYVLVTYTSVNHKDDTVKTGDLKSTIYVLKRPDNSFVAGYCEQKVEPQSVAK